MSVYGNFDYIFQICLINTYLTNNDVSFFLEWGFGSCLIFEINIIAKITYNLRNKYDILCSLFHLAQHRTNKQTNIQTNKQTKNKKTHALNYSENKWTKPIIIRHNFLFLIYSSTNNTLDKSCASSYVWYHIKKMLQNNDFSITKRRICRTKRWIEYLPSNS